MGARTLRLVAVLAGVALAGCRAQKVKQPQERDLSGTTFPHSAHEGVGCATCHEDVTKANRLGVYRPPTVEKCLECHEHKTAADKETYRPPARAARDAYTIRFDHAGHLARMKDKKDDAACLACHSQAALPEPGARARPTPPMATCTACHQHAKDVSEARCTPCHVSLKRFPLQPIAQFTEFSHGVNFIREHGRMAESSVETCAQCHDQTYCATCHANATLPLRPEIRFPENVTSDFIHRGDYTSRHQYDVERDPASCRKCHGERFCDSCHQAQRISPGVANARNPHPPGWVRRGSGAFHGDAARQNIVNCASCHDQGAASNCVACHQVGGVGGNPHPRGFLSKHEREDIGKNVACRACHRQ
jgi:hypothetical protein